MGGWCREKGERLAGFEGFAMFGSNAVFVDSLKMGFGAVTDVLVETVCGIFGRDLSHVVVAGDFSNNGGGGDFADFVVGLDTGGDVFC